MLWTHHPTFESLDELSAEYFNFEVDFLVIVVDMALGSGRTSCDVRAALCVRERCLL